MADATEHDQSELMLAKTRVRATTICKKLVMITSALSRIFRRVNLWTSEKCYDGRIRIRGLRLIKIVLVTV
jgi:hypothetical protein